MTDPSSTSELMPWRPVEPSIPTRISPFLRKSPMYVWKPIGFSYARSFLTGCLARLCRKPFHLSHLSTTILYYTLVYIGVIRFCRRYKIVLKLKLPLPRKRLRLFGVCPIVLIASSAAPKRPDERWGSQVLDRISRQLRRRRGGQRSLDFSMVEDISEIEKIIALNWPGWLVLDLCQNVEWTKKNISAVL